MQIPYFRWSERQLENMYCVQKPCCVLSWLQHPHKTADRRRFLPRGAVLEVLQVSWCPPSQWFGLQQLQQFSCLGEPCKVSYNTMSPFWDTKVTCGVASPRASGRFWWYGCLIKTICMCSGKTVCRRTPETEEHWFTFLKAEERDTNSSGFINKKT